MTTLLDASTDAGVFAYNEAFSRNLGLLSQDEQERLRTSRVAIIGMGGVGGIHLATLARLGIGSFTIADPDTYELANFNRQYGAKVRSIGRSKVEVMAEEALDINPELEIRRMDAPIDESNIDEFLKGADLVVDGVDFFAIETRRLVFDAARKRGIWTVTAGPHAFGAAWLAFDPNGMSFDRFFDFHDGMSQTDQFVAFCVGCVPSPLHLAYVDLKSILRPGARAGSSVGFACSIAAGIVGAYAVRILLNRPGTRAAPWYGHFDAYRQKLVTRRLRLGNRHPWQLAKRWWLQRQLSAKPHPGHRT